MAKTPAWAAATIGLLVVTGCADSTNLDASGPSASRQPRQCFSARDARNFAAVNSRTVNLRIGRDIYRIDTLGTCPDLNWTHRMALRTSGSSMICVGPGLGTSIVIRGSGGRRQRCAIQSITALTPDQIRALPPRHRP